MCTFKCDDGDGGGGGSGNDGGGGDGSRMVQPPLGPPQTHRVRSFA
jgi:hypothetical protein